MCKTRKCRHLCFFFSAEQAEWWTHSYTSASTLLPRPRLIPVFGARQPCFLCKPCRVRPSGPPSLPIDYPMQIRNLANLSPSLSIACTLVRRPSVGLPAQHSHLLEIETPSCRRRCFLASHISALPCAPILLKIDHCIVGACAVPISQEAWTE